MEEVLEVFDTCRFQAAKDVASLFSCSSFEKPVAVKPPKETSELIFEGVPMTPGPAEPSSAKTAGQVLAGNSKEGDKAPGQTGQDKAQGDTSKGTAIQAVPLERSEVGQALGLTIREEDCFQILGRQGRGWSRQGALG